MRVEIAPDGTVVIEMTPMEAKALKEVLVEARPRGEDSVAYDRWYRLTRVTQTLVVKLAIALREPLHL